MHRFLVIIEKTNGTFSAYSPDLPGCIAAGVTREEVKKNMENAIAMHIQGMVDDNLPIPQSESSVEYISVA